ncbi:hypothetical protein [Glycomyces salinus]|uniref:hypothetical protein n=1 Tax=Glycomyces salinus TaxID=980294 RepID=UPI0018ED5A9A|nr:hypothetical protein [Glycomyces salinus]
MAMTLRLSSEIEDTFREESAEAGVSMNSAAEEAILDWINHRQRERVREVAEGIAERHARLLARLAE